MESAEATMTGVVIGTPLYMSPEQVQGILVDKRTDIYSVGITMYELLTCKPPFYEGDLAYQHLHVPPEPIDGIPDALKAIIMKCLEKNRDERYPNAEDLCIELQKVTQLPL
jgi:serine/threonine-protein kinase